jgi:hypothetical protein
MTKECKKCGAEKPLEAFYVDKAKRDGRASWCSVCTKERMRQWEQQNRARVNERTAANYRRNLEESRAKARAKKARRDERLREQRRDEFAPNLCAYCLAPATDYDHIEPIVLGGSDGIETRVKPQRDWRMSDMRFLRDGDIDGWAESVIHPDDIDEFMELDITMDEFREFSEEAARRSGDSLGKSSGRSRSSKPMRRR